MRVTSRPEMVEERISPNIMGSMAMPLLVAETPRPSCRYSGTKVMAPKKDMEMTKAAPLPSEKTLLRNRSSGSSGSETLSSTKTNSASDATVTASSPRMVGESQAY